MMVFVLSLALAATAIDTPPDSGQPTTTEPTKPKKICKTVKITGSTIGRRTCKTQEQWDASQDASIDTINQGYKQNVGANDPFGGREAPR